MDGGRGVFTFEKFHGLRVGEKEEIRQVKGQSGSVYPGTHSAQRSHQEIGYVVRPQIGDTSPQKLLDKRPQNAEHAKLPGQCLLLAPF